MSTSHPPTSPVHNSNDSLSIILHKKKNFTVSDNGEFDDGIYREQVSSGMIARLIGRGSSHPHEKATFTTADICMQGYLYKRGSWFKSWKRRYFILRRDIGALCYFPSQEQLTLLGSIKLGVGSSIEYVGPSDADGLSNVMAIRSSPDESMDKAVLIRAEETEAMVKWTQKILSEIFRNSDPVQHVDSTTTADRWSTIFESAHVVEGLTKPRRPPAKTIASTIGDKDIVAPTALPKPNTKHNETVANIANSLAMAALNDTDVHKTVSSSSLPANDTQIALSQVDLRNELLFNETGLSNIDLYDASELPPVDSDDEEDAEDVRPHVKDSRQSSTADASPHERVDSNSSDGIKHAVSHRFAESATIVHKQISTVRPPRANKRPTINKRALRKAKEKKKDKQPGPPPFAFVNADRFVSPKSKIVGYQFSLQLQNSCGFQDKILVLVYTCSYVAGAANNSSLDFTLRAQTEVVVINERPEYGRTTLDNVVLHFCLPMSPINQSFDYVYIQVFKLDAGSAEDTKVKEGNKVKPGDISPNMNKISYCFIPRKSLEDKHVFKVSMRVSNQTTPDLSNPIEVKIGATLGIVRMSSSALFMQRKWMSEALNMQPYSEVPYSFATSAGQTLSLEQLYVSRYSILVANALGQLATSERKPILTTLTSILEDEEEQMRVERSKLDGIERSNEADIDHYNAICAKHESLLDDLDILEDISMNVFDPHVEAVDFAQAIMAGAEIVSNKVIGADVGGCFLRRSVWKKEDNWQYSTVNLNVHLMTSQHFSFSDLANPKSKQRVTVRDLHVVPTITLGCPAAHVLKYHDGGLRRLFGGLPNDLHRLMWMYVLQSQYFSESFLNLFKNYAKDASILFNVPASSLTLPSMAVQLTKKRFELANRLDMCTSQILGFAVTSVRTVCLLAAQNGGRYMDVLARSLKIGFLLCLQSLLSTQGDELGMIEDLDMAALWLHLVTMRLVTYPMSSASVAASAAVVGEDLPNDPNDGRQCDERELRVRRDLNGRLIVDVMISQQEAEAVAEAKRLLDDFDYDGYNPFRQYNEEPTDSVFHPPLLFSDNVPIRESDDYEQIPIVHAIAEITAVAFSQGVNEMQTFANMSSLKDCQRQAEINTASFVRLREYFSRYLRAYRFQVSCKSEALIDHSPQKNAIDKSVRALTRASTVGNFHGVDNAIDVVIESHLEAAVKLLEDASASVSLASHTPAEKHVNVLLKTSAVCREIGGVVGILCKSGKDRTSMAVTLETARSLVEELGGENGMELCQVTRIHGVRRMNVYANTGQPMFAFNPLQRLAIPMCYRPPPNTCSGTVNS